MVSSVASSSVRDAARRRSILAASLGNALEWFDWTLYATFSVYIAGNFFAASDPVSALLSTMAVFAVGFIARPLGGFFFGRLGDRVGRKDAMLISMMVLAASSLILAVLPTYESVGLWASGLLVAARLIQGLAHGGEVGVSYTYVAEVAPPPRRGLWSSTVYVSITIGVMAATTLAALLTGALSRDDMMAWGWRIGFVFGGLLGLFALWMRRRAIETDAFQIEQASGAAESAGGDRRVESEPSRREILAIGLRVVTLSVGINVGYYTWVTFMPSVAIAQHGMNPTSAFLMSLLAQGIIVFFLPLFGYLADRLGRKPMAFAHGVAIALFTFPISLVLGSSPWSLLVAQLLGLLAWAIMGAMYPAVVAEQVPTRMRALVVGLVTSLSVAVFGGTGPYLNTWLQSTGHGWIFNLYVVLLGVICIVGSFWIKESAGQDLATNVLESRIVPDEEKARVKA